MIAEVGLDSGRNENFQQMGRVLEVADEDADVGQIAHIPGSSARESEEWDKRSFRFRCSGVVDGRRTIAMIDLFCQLGGFFVPPQHLRDEGVITGFFRRRASIAKDQLRRQRRFRHHTIVHFHRGRGSPIPVADTGRAGTNGDLRSGMIFQKPHPHESGLVLVVQWGRRFTCAVEEPPRLLHRPAGGNRLTRLVVCQISHHEEPIAPCSQEEKPSHSLPRTIASCCSYRPLIAFCVYVPTKYQSPLIDFCFS